VDYVKANAAQRSQQPAPHNVRLPIYLGPVLSNENEANASALIMLLLDVDDFRRPII